MEERALVEMRMFEEKIKFENLMIEAGEILPEKMVEKTETMMKKKVHEIAEEFRAESANAIKNIFADILSVCAFSWLLIASKREMQY
jgi:hypothetical protein